MWSLFSRDPAKDFAYDICDPIEFVSERSFWKLYKGKKKGSGEEVTVFILESKNATSAEVDAAKAAVKRLKTLRHPNILTFYDSAESDKAIYLATESVEPLEKHLKTKECLQGDLSISWGLFQVTRALSFLINDGNLNHNCINLGCVYVNTAGEWKLGGFEFVSNESTTRSVVKVPSILHRLDPPEFKNGTNCIVTKWSTDSYGLGILIWEVFNGLANDVPSTRLKNVGKIPKSLGTIYLELTSENVQERPNAADVIARGRRPGGFYKNDLVDSLLFLEEIQIKETNDKAKFFNGLPNALDKFPPNICRYKILPQLLNALEFGNAGSSVLAPLFKLGKLLDEPEYQSKIVPCIVKLFSSTERATRVRLLQQLEHFVGHLPAATINEKIFANLTTGFLDTNPMIREQTVKAMLYLAPKLNNNNLNTELLKHFAKLQIKDDQGGIRTNTTICLGKIACYLHPQTRRKVLIPAFTRVFQDIFPPAKIAGILALEQTQKYHLLSDVSTKILPALCSLTSDPEKSVRDNAFKTISGFLGKLEKVSEDPSLAETFEADIDTNTAGAVDSASTWAGWALTSLTSKFHRSQSQQSSLGQIGHPQPTPAVVRTKGKYPFGGQSSSSTSTTTSSIPSTPQSADILGQGQESATDYDEDWEEDWGSIDVKSNNSAGTLSKPTFEALAKNKEAPTAKNPDSEKSKSREGWENWAIEEQDEKSGWNNEDLVPEKLPAVSTTSNWGTNTLLRSDVSEAVNNINNMNEPSPNTAKIGSTDWDSEEWLQNPLSDIPKTGRNEEMRKRREERKLLRQHELETKRSSKAGPMKLGSKLSQ